MRLKGSSYFPRWQDKEILLWLGDLMNSVCQVGDISCCYTSHAEGETPIQLGTRHSSDAEICFPKSELIIFLDNSIPYPAITSHVYVEFFC
jgi:hypothetical protein